MEDLLRQILRKLDEIDRRIANIEDELASYEEVVEGPTDDFDREFEELMPKAIMILENMEKLTYSSIQKKLECSYAIASRVAERLTELGLIVPDISEKFYAVNTEEVKKFLHKTNDKGKWN